MKFKNNNFLCGFVLISFLLSILLTGGDLKANTNGPDKPVGKAQNIRKWDIASIKRKVNYIRAGRNLKPRKWPNNSKVAVLLSFDFDTETIWLRDGDLTPSNLAQGEYGARRGIPRILELFDNYNIPGSFFIPAVSALLHKKEVNMILGRKQNHEIGVHGWIHEQIEELSPEEEEKLIEKAFDVIKKLSGRSPQGYRSPSWAFTHHTLNIVKKLGFTYDSSLMADDDPYEILENGERTGIVELPVSWLLDDYVFFRRYNQYMKPADVLQMWKDNFDKAYEEGSIFVLTMHPHVIGQRGRINILKDLIVYIKSKDSVWFATLADAVNYIKNNTL